MPSSSSGDMRDGSLSGARVLVVEDNDSVGMAIVSALTDSGMLVAGPATTPAEAKRLTKVQRPDLVLMDLNLGGELAVDLIHWLHQRRLRVIAMSGVAELPKSIRDTAFLQKPFGADELLTTMRDVMLAA
jgi:DNA-binding response OmpR family regulator